MPTVGQKCINKEEKNKLEFCRQVHVNERGTHLRQLLKISLHGLSSRFSLHWSAKTSATSTRWGDYTTCKQTHSSTRNERHILQIEEMHKCFLIHFGLTLHWHLNVYCTTPLQASRGTSIQQRTYFCLLTTYSFEMKCEKRRLRWGGLRFLIERSWWSGTLCFFFFRQALPRSLPKQENNSVSFTTSWLVADLV